MSEKDKGKDKAGVSGRRSTAVRLGGLAAGAVLGAALGASVAGTEHGGSIGDQFEAAYTPGAAMEINRMGSGIVVPGDVN
ncbi:hypothetical protein [Krasilnikovia sp. M28-CT-15]|uniref:hypothetical protein n=1 Tax=Krasilnikovia sp. M28-CT-15 TaxID=3373540 RepID=UPI00387745C6